MTTFIERDIERDMELVTLDEAAEIAGVARETVRKWIRRHGLRAQLMDGRVYVSVGSLWQIEGATRRSGRGRHRVLDFHRGFVPP